MREGPGPAESAKPSAEAPCGAAGGGEARGSLRATERRRAGELSASAEAAPGSRDRSQAPRPAAESEPTPPRASRGQVRPRPGGRPCQPCAAGLRAAAGAGQAPRRPCPARPRDPQPRPCDSSPTIKLMLFTVDKVEQKSTRKEALGPLISGDNRVNVKVPFLPFLVPCKHEQTVEKKLDHKVL